MNKTMIEMPVMDEILTRLADIEQKLDEVKKPFASNAGLLNTKEAAKALGISLRTLQEKRKRMEISFIQHGDIVRFRPQDIEAYLNAHYINIKVMKGLVA